MKYILIAFLTFSFAYGQSAKGILKKNENFPFLFIDSVNVEKEDLKKYNEKDIGSVTVYKENEARELIGDDGKDGVIYIQTKTFCKKRYWKYFSSKSPQYKNLVNSWSSDTNVQYILNDKILKENFEGDLSFINDKIFKSIKFISKEELQNKYKIEDKDFGFLIISDIPENLRKIKQ